MRLRVAFYLVIIGTFLLSSAGLGLLSGRGSGVGGRLTAAVAAPLAGSNNANNAANNAANNGGNNGNDNQDNKNKNDNGDGGGGEKAPKPPKPAPPPPPPPGEQVVIPGPCTFVLGFAYLHSILGGRDGICADNEHNDPNGTGDRVQTTRRLDGIAGYMVWQLFTNTMRWTDGYWTFTYSKCGLQQRLNSQAFAWELNPYLMQQPGPIPPQGACDVV